MRDDIHVVQSLQDSDTHVSFNRYQHDMASASGLHYSNHGDEIC